MALLVVELSQFQPVVVGNVFPASHYRLRHLLHHPPASQFTGGNEGDGLGLAHTLVCHEVLHLHASQLPEAACTVLEDVLHQGHCRHVLVAAADEDGQQFAVGKRFHAFGQKFLARTVLFCQLLDFERAFHVGY